ncbi:hypothetical protein FRC01_008111 [Tulasnella sp. 417]|nr:hypothetical protein FRC01_008111 [Tulasnella sp. 417]
MSYSQSSDTPKNATQVPWYYIPGAQASNSYIRKILRIMINLITLPWAVPLRLTLYILGFGGSTTTSEEEGYGWEDRVALEKALQHFDSSGILPPGSRINPWGPQKQPQNIWSIVTVIKLCWFLNTKGGPLAGSRFESELTATMPAVQVSKAIIHHSLFGPKLPSWSIEMTILSALMQNLSKHSELTNWWLIRQAMDLVERVPVPKSFVIRRVAFRVQKHCLPGVLKDLDAKEDGNRILNGEWIVDRHIWESRRMGYIDSKHEAAGERVMLYLHGGAYYICSAETHRLITVNLSKACGLRVFGEHLPRNALFGHANQRIICRRPIALNYRLAPETRFPGALQDSVLAYLHLIKELQVPPSHIIIAGDSAGGGLTLATLLYLRDSNLPLPGGAILMSPWVDLTLSMRSWETNARYDVCPMPEPGDHLDPVRCYLGEQALRNGLVTHPYVSPLFAKYDVNEREGRNRLLPPLLIQCGGAEVLRDECTLLAHKAAKGGVQVMFEYYEDAVHVFQTFTWLQPAGKAYERCGVFIKHTIPAYEVTEAARLRHGIPPTIKEEDEIAPRDITGEAEPRTIDEAAEEAIETRVDEEIGGGDSSEMIVVDSMGAEEDEVLVPTKGEPTSQGDENGEEAIGKQKVLVIKPDPLKEGTTDAYEPVERRSSAKTEQALPRTTLSAPGSIPRSQSTTSLPISRIDGLRNPLYGNCTPPSSQRRHSRRWTGLGALHGFTPLHVGSKGDRGGDWLQGEASTDDGAGWAFTPGSNFTSARGSVSFASSGPLSPASTEGIPGLERGSNAYLADSSTIAPPQISMPCGSTTPLATPGIRRGRRSRSSTLSSENGPAGEEVENLVRQWEKDGPANESVFCRKL